MGMDGSPGDGPDTVSTHAASRVLDERGRFAEPHRVASASGATRRRVKRKARCA